MTGPDLTRPSRRVPGPAWACVLTALALTLPADTVAQQTRVQLAATDQLSDELHLMLGADEVIALGGGDCEPGGPICEEPSWQLLIGAYGGVTIADVPLSLYTHLGVQYLLTDSYALGLIGFGFMQPLQGGAAVRFDAIDVVAFKAGYAWGDEDGVMIGLEVAGQLILDLFR